MAAENTTPELTPEQRAELAKKLEPPPKPLLPVQPKHAAGAGGWTPKKATPVVVAVFCGIATSVVPVLMMPAPTWNVIAASVIGGAATSLAAYFGMRSAGSRAP